MPGSEGGCAEKARVHDPRTRDLAAQPTLPGYDLISAIVNAGGHVVARVKAGISLPMEPGGGWLPDGSRMTWLNAPSGKKDDRLPVRAAEHNAVLPCGDGEEVSETCTLITTLLDHRAAPTDAVRETYLTRWSASETTFGEDKATITGAGNRTSGPVLRSGSPSLVIQEAWAWLAAAQLVRTSAAAALRSEAAAARALRRKDNALVTADEESFTAVLRHAIRSMTSSQVTASSSLAALAAAADAAARAACTPSTSPVASGTRRGPRKPARIRAYLRGQADHHRETRGQRVRARLLVARRQDRNARKEEPPPPARGRGPWNCAIPAAARGPKLSPHPVSATRKTDSKTDTDYDKGNTPGDYEHLESPVLTYHRAPVSSVPSPPSVPAAAG